MADYTLSAVIKLKDELSKNVDKAKAKLKSLDKQSKDNTTSLGKLRQSFKDSSEEISNVVSTIAKVGTGAFVGIVAGGWAAYKEYADLNQVMKKNSVLLGANADEAKKLEEQVAFLGKTTAFTSKEVAQAQKYQIMAGYDLNKVLETTPKLLKLAIVAEEDLGRTSDLVTDTMDALGLKTQDLGRYLDVISNVANKSNTSVSGLMEAFLRGASTNVAFGDSLENTTALLGILANNGKKGADAGTFLNAVTANFASESLKNKQMIEQQTKYGIKFYKKTKEGGVVFKGMTKIIEELRPKLAKMTEAQRNQFLVTMVGKEHLSDFIKLLNASPESFKNMENAAKNSEGALEDVYSGLDDTHLNNIKKLKSAFEGLRLEVGKAIAPVMLEYVKQLTTEINNLKSDDIKKFVDDAKVIFDGLTFSMKMLVEALKLVKETAEAGMSVGQSAADITTLGKTYRDRKSKIEEINDINEVLGKEKTKLTALDLAKHIDRELEKAREEFKKAQDELLLKNMEEKKENSATPNLTEAVNNIGGTGFEYKPKPVQETKKEVKISFGDVHINNGMDKDNFFKELTEVLNYA